MLFEGDVLNNAKLACTLIFLLQNETSLFLLALLVIRNF